MVNRLSPLWLASLLLFQAFTVRAEGPSLPRLTLDIQGQRYALELALTRESRATGLSGRTRIPDDGGMLFVYPQPQSLVFWMYLCLVDIDVAFLDPQGRVLAVYEMQAEPPPGPGESPGAYRQRLRRYQSPQPGQFALELRAGSLRELGIHVGDKLDLPLAELVRQAR